MIAWALAAVTLVLAVAGGGCDRFDVVLANGWVVDEAGDPKYRADVAARDDRSVATGRLEGARALRTGGNDR